MMNAKEARANVENYKNELARMKEERVNKFLETTVAREIEENSKNGYTVAKVTTFGDRTETELMIKKLEELGYEVSELNNSFVLVEW